MVAKRAMTITRSGALKKVAAYCTSIMSTYRAAVSIWDERTLVFPTTKWRTSTWPTGHLPMRACAHRTFGITPLTVMLSEWERESDNQDMDEERC